MEAQTENWMTLMQAQPPWIGTGAPETIGSTQGQVLAPPEMDGLQKQWQ